MGWNWEIPFYIMLPIILGITILTYLAIEESKVKVQLKLYDEFEVTADIERQPP